MARVSPWLTPGCASACPEQAIAGRYVWVGMGRHTFSYILESLTGFGPVPLPREGVARKEFVDDNFFPGLKKVFNIKAMKTNPSDREQLFGAELFASDVCDPWLPVSHHLHYLGSD